MENKLNIPEGEYIVVPATETDCSIINILEKQMVMIMPIGLSDIEETNIAIVSCDSLNTYQQCNLLPSELLRQRDEAVRILNLMLDNTHWYSIGGNGINVAKHFLSSIKNNIENE